MHKFLLCTGILGALVTAWISPASAQVFDNDTFTVEQIASKNQAIVMSTVFPGLGQMALGYKFKGFGLFAGELISLIVAINGNENYKTLKAHYSKTEDEYLALRQGGRFEAAQEMWEDLQDMESDLDRYHTIRQAIYLSAGIYAYNLIDILFLSPVRGQVK